jgi:E3 ubiquitin-protein ligase DOA10
MTPTLRHEEQQKNNSINNNTATTSSSSLSSSRLHRLQRQQQQQQVQQQQREEVIDQTVIQPNDVLFGRGAFTNNRPGNILFRELVAQAKEAYDEADRSRRIRQSMILL